MVHGAGGGFAYGYGGGKARRSSMGNGTLLSPAAAAPVAAAAVVAAATTTLTKSRGHAASTGDTEFPLSPPSRRTPVEHRGRALPGIGPGQRRCLPDRGHGGGGGNCLWRGLAWRPRARTWQALAAAGRFAARCWPHRSVRRASMAMPRHVACGARESRHGQARQSRARLGFRPSRGLCLSVSCSIASGVVRRLLYFQDNT